MFLALFEGSAKTPKKDLLGSFGGPYGGIPRVFGEVGRGIRPDLERWREGFDDGKNWKKGSRGRKRRGKGLRGKIFRESFGKPPDRQIRQGPPSPKTRVPPPVRGRSPTPSLPLAYAHMCGYRFFSNKYLIVYNGV